MISRIRVPENVVAATCARWTTVSDFWPTVAEGELLDLCARHGVTPLRAVPARYSFVVAADGQHRNLILRATPDPGGPDQAVAAQVLAGCMAGPAVHEVAHSTACTWTVQDRVTPGTALSEATPGSITLDDLAKPFRALQVAPTSARLPRIVDWLQARLADETLTDRAAGSSVASATDRQYAADLLRDIDESGEVDSICHGDAHPGNLLLSHTESRILMIDPRGMSGDIAYDLGVISLKASRYERTAAGALGRQMAAEVGVDASRVLAWIEIAHIARV